MRKSSIQELAIFPETGKPLFNRYVHVGRPNLGDRSVFDKLVDQIWTTRQLTNNGPLVQELEKRVAAELGVAHVIAVCNGTLGLQIAARAVFDTCGEVIVPAFTFTATVGAMRNIGLKPVFCDVDATTHTLDVQMAESLITSRTRGILAVHLWGRPCDTNTLQELSLRTGVPVIYDAAHAYGSRAKGERVGTFGRCEVFSLHATKFFGSGEGGLISTNDDSLADRLRKMRNLGFAGTDNVVTSGTNAKMPELSAAMALSALPCLRRYVERNWSNYKAYSNGLRGIPGIALYEYAEPEHYYYNYQYIVVVVDQALFGLKRDQLVCLLIAENVSARRYFYPGCHRPAWSEGNIPPPVVLPVTDLLCQQVVCLPTGCSVDEREIEAICALIQFAHLNAAALEPVCGTRIEPTPEQLKLVVV